MQKHELMRAAATSLEKVSAAIREAQEGKEIKLERAVRRAAGEEETARKALEAISNLVLAPEFMLDEWAAENGHGKTSSALATCASRLRWAADEAENPDSLKAILAGRLERGLIHIPVGLVRDLFVLGTAVREIKARRRKSEDVEPLAKDVLDAAEKWAAAVMDGRTEGVLGFIEPEDVPF